MSSSHPKKRPRQQDSNEDDEDNSLPEPEEEVAELPDQSQSRADAGIIKRIDLVNFMCHECVIMIITGFVFFLPTLWFSSKSAESTHSVFVVFFPSPLIFRCLVSGTLS